MTRITDIVVTGLGVVSPIGIGREAMWRALRQGVSGVRPYDLLARTPLPVKIGAPVSDFDPKQYVKPRKSLKVMSREIQTGFAAAALAAEDAGLAAGAVDPDRFGVVFGSEMLYCELEELVDLYRNCLDGDGFHFDRFGARSASDLFPLWMLKYLPNMAACHIGIAYDARGPSNSITLGEVSSLSAIQEAARVIERGHADVMIAGGAGNRLGITQLLYRGDANLSHRADQPAAASRPFDLHRDGMVNGEGAGAVILERRAHAVARGARILASVAGFGNACESRLNGRPASGDAMRMAIRRALTEAEVSAPREIGFVSANGVSTVEDDRLEAAAIRELLGDVAVFAPKSYFGNLGAGGGAVELVAAVMALQHHQAPPTLNYETPDPACPINVVHGQPRDCGPGVALVLSQSGTGQAVTAVLVRESAK